MSNEEKLRDYLKLVTAHLQQTRRQLREVQEQSREPVAIVGMACRFPGGVRDPDQFWQLLTAGTDAVSGLPGGRGWDLAGLYDPDPARPGTSTVRSGGFVHDAGQFDPGFFGISPREALAMDPQQRLLLETSWEALERAGIDPGSLRGSPTGVFAGASLSGYGSALQDGDGSLESHLLTGTANSVISGRVAFSFGLEGPAVSVDTACSSSLVALHLAVQALRSGECSLALAGAVTVLASPTWFVWGSRQLGLAPDGRCKPFSAAADGMGLAEGAGMLVLERLSDARRNGHEVLAVVRGSAVNQDGASNGLTAPNGPSQQRVIQAALAGAGLTPDDIDAVEAHGTGTELGDPIEAQALLAAYGQNRDPERPLWTGSVKSNIGHTQAAAGVAGLIKMVLALRHGVLPRTLHVEEPTPLVDWTGGLRLLAEPVDWAPGDRPRRAGVSSFGMSGTNAHVILEEDPAGTGWAAVGESPAEDGDESAAAAEQPPAAAAAPVLTGAPSAWLLSGRSAAGLPAQAARLAEFLADRPAAEVNALDIGWSLATTRATFGHRAVILGADPDELASGLSAMAAGESAPGLVAGSVPAGGASRVGFLFAGQGAQRAGMGRELYAASAVFASVFDQACALLEAELGLPIRDVVLGPDHLDQADGAEAEPDPRADQTVYAQAGLFAVEAGLVAMLAAAGVVPDAVAGHSVGEIAAAHAAGVLSLPDACRLVAARGRLMQALPEGGAMAAIEATEAEITEALAGIDGVGLAALNGPTSVVVSGDAEAVDRLTEIWRERGRRVRRLRVSHAFHSARMDPVLADLAQTAAALDHQIPAVTWAGALTGDLISVPDPDYWTEQARRPVRFADAVAALAGQGVSVFIEIGPDMTLSALGPAALAGTDHADAADAAADAVFIPVLRPKTPVATSVLTALARAHVRGVAVDWSAVLPAGRRVPLPTYAFARRQFWAQSSATGTATGDDAVTTEAERLFWAAVEEGDLATVAGTLAVDGSRPLSEVLPALWSWRRRERREAVTAGWRYRISWEPIADPGIARLSGTWLVIGDAASGEQSAEYASILAARGAEPALLDIAPGRLGRDAVAARIAELLAERQAAGCAPVAGVLSLPALNDTPQPRFPVVPAGLAATLTLVQALGDAGLQAPLWVLTREAVATRPDEIPVGLAQAQVWGLGRVVALEHPERWGGLIDLPAVLDDPAAGRLVAVLAGRGEDQVAIRGAGILGRRLVRASAARTGAARWSTLGTTLITGDAGTIGETTARWLAERSATKLALAGRSGPGAPGAARLAAFLADAGTTVELLAADLAHRDQTSALLDRINRADSPLTAVIHTAGTEQAIAVDDTTVADLADVLGEKAAGALWLDELTRTLDLDAFVLFSSICATWGSGRQSGPAAANALLDALAESRRARGLAATSVAWGPWADQGLAVGDDGDRTQRRGLKPMDPAQGIRGLGQALDTADTCVTVADVDWARFASTFTLRRPSPLIAGLPEVVRASAAADGTSTGGPAPGTALGRQLAGLSAPDQTRILLDLTRARIAAVLGHASLDDVQPDRAFTDLGFDSLTAVELRDRLGAATGLRLPATLVFDYPTPAAAAEYLRDRLTGAAHSAGRADADRFRPSAAGEPIAIVGIGCRFPGGADTPEAFWRLLADGTDVIGRFPVNRGWNTEDLFDPDPDREGTSHIQSGGFLHAADEFDPGFFGISPREALTMDPQQRLLLETSWEALERAGIDPAALRGSRTGVFAGGTASRYGADRPEGTLDGGLVTGTATSVLSGRISYTLGLEGPALTVDTACSSGLVALHLAAQALRSGECTLALAGAAFVTASPLMFTDFSRALGLAPDGRCKAFGADADGMGVAEGAGMVVVERLSDARRNGHRVLAIVAGSAVNQDGASNGLTAPNGPAQQRVIRDALAGARLSAADVDAVEAHGTGTPLGDPIEAQALLATYGQDRPEGRPLWLGSVKSNIGHAQQAAGAAGLIKMVLALHNGLLPRTLHAQEKSPHVDWSAGDIELLTEERAWTPGARPRRAGVSAFGISGTNAHVILQEAPAYDAEPTDESEPEPSAEDAAAEPILPVFTSAPPVWLLSARSGAGLTAQAQRLASYVSAAPEPDPADVAWSLAVSRSVLEYRAAVVGADRADLLAGLDAVAADRRAAAACRGLAAAGPAGRIAFAFPGQGAQWVGMGRDLAAASPVFAARLAECAAALAPYVDWNLDDVLAGRDGAPGLDRADVVQPALWAVMVSLAAVWAAAGVTPDAVVGHSQGEIAAACVAGILTLRDAAKVVAIRSRALSGLAVSAGMLSVVMPVASVEELLAGNENRTDRLSVAAVNGPASTVVSGDLEALDEFERELSARRVLRWRIPQTDFVAHSVRVEQLRDALIRDLADIRPQTGRAALYSSVTGRQTDGAELDAAYWYANVRERVQFQDATAALAAAGFRTFIEVSPQPVLISPITETLDELGVCGEPLITGTVERESSGAARFLLALARAHVHGVTIDWARVLPAAAIVDLPTYAFQRQKYWLHPVARTASAKRPDSAVLEGWRYRVSWPAIAEPAPARLAGTWLLVAGQSEATRAEAVTRALTGHGAQVLGLRLSPAGAGADADADAPAHREDLAEQIRAAIGETPIAGVLSLLAVDETPLPGRPAVPAGLSGTLTLIQALGDAGLAAPLWVATRGAVATGPDEALTGPAQAQAWGLSRVAALEHPDRWGGLVDLPAELDEPAAARLAAVLAGCGEDQVAIRADAIRGRRLVRAPRQDRADGPWTPRGSILITGGTGAIGRHVARWLTERDAPRVVLVSRSGPSADATAALAAELATSGTAVEILAGDTGARPDLAALLARVAANGPALTGVMHTAGVVDNGVIDRLDPARLSSVLAAKAGSAALLDELTADLDLDAFVLFSSAAATFGAGGQGNYAAANAYLDALARNRRDRGLAALSIAWGPWAGGGVAQAGEATVARLSRNRWEVLMEPRLAVRALADALGGPDSVLTIMDIDWNLIESAGGEHEMRSAPFLRDLAEVQRMNAGSGTGASDGARATRDELIGQLVALPRAGQEQRLTALVQSVAADVLAYPSLEAVEPGRAFSDLGFDSLTAVELRNRLSSAVGLRLPASLLFDYPTSTALAEHLRAELLGDAAAVRPAQITAAADGEPIAIVGMGCRFPGGVRTPDQLWDLLISGTDAISGFPADRGWDLDRLYHADPGHSGTTYVRAGGFVHEAGRFDPAFFGISPREALAMDPQQRLLLETSWEALERAGIEPATLRGSQTGVFAGGYSSGYAAVGAQTGADGAAGLEGHLMAGNATSVISGRVAYTLGLEGPAVTMDTACSSSLVALHLAAQALRSGECTLALAGGVTIMATPWDLVVFSRQRGLAPDGRSKAFGADADGMGMAEGVGMLVLERLCDARANGHEVLALIRGSAINQDGASNGLTAPNGPSQQRVIRAALANARLTPADVDVVEAHGTGTPLGDPIEAQALLATYGQDRPDGRPLWLGSVKSNIGHTQAAAGVAGVMKMVLALRHGKLPRSLHSETPSPHVDWAAGDVRLLSEPVDWPVNGRIRRAGVSAFGISGTNAHTIIEEAPGHSDDSTEPASESTDPAVTDPSEPSRPAVLTGQSRAWLVSGRTPAALLAQAARLHEYLSARTESNPAAAADVTDLAWSLATTRSPFEHRAVVLGADRETLSSGLAALAAGGSSPSVITAGAVPAARPKVGFLFAGQGAQRAGMGRELHAASPVFAAAFDEACALVEQELNLPIREVVLGTEEDDRADQTLYAQTGLFAVEVGLVAVLAAAGIRPDAVAGHSVGEIAAAHTAGVLTLADAARLVATRARLMQDLPTGGAMGAVEATEAEAAETLAGFHGVEIAAVNGPSAVVVSGDAEGVDQILETWRARGRRARRLRVSHAFHSARMDPMLAELAQTASALEHSAPAVLWAGACTGDLVTAPEADYWPAQARQAVRFADTVAVLAGQGISVFIEIGPDGTLSALGPAAVPGTGADRTDADNRAATDPVFIALLRARTAAADAVLTAIARAYVRGVRVDWTAILPAGNRVDLPTYAFAGQRFWPLGPHKLRLGVPAGSGDEQSGGAAEARLWAAVESGDRAALSDTLAVEDARLGDLLPMLAAWRRRERDRSATDGWRYRVTWAPVADPEPAALTGIWLVVTGDAGVDHADRCVQALTDHGAEVVVTRINSATATRESLAADLAVAAGVSGVVSLLALDETPLADRPMVTAGLAATLTLIQALGDARIQASLWLLTSEAVAAEPGEPPARPLQAQVWGLGRVVGLEHPERWGGLIDLPPVLDDPAADRLCAVLAGCGDEDQVAVRAGGIRGRRLVRAPQPEQTETWTPSGTALITGGTGSIGGHTARWLAGRGARRIVLTSRTGPAATGAVALAAELAAAGTTANVLAADIARREHVAGLLAWTEAAGPPLSAVLHAAGAGQATALQDTTVAELAEMASVKTAGTTHLDELTADLNLEAFVLFSSVSATWGSGLQPGYAAVNAFLDALAENRRSRGLAATSVAWGPWDGGGMSDREGKAQMVRRGLRLLDPELGIRALGQALDGGETLLTVADVDWAAFAPTFTLRRPSPLIGSLPEVARAIAGAGTGPDEASGGAGNALAEQLSALSREDQDHLLADLVRTEAAAVLSYPSPQDVPADRAFSDLGADSLTAVELRDRLGAATGLRLSATLLFDYTTPAAVAGYLRAALVPEGDCPAKPVLAELDKLEGMLSAALGADADAARITARLEAVAARWKETAAGGRAATVAEDLASSSDDEVFAFIGKELGIH